MKIAFVAPQAESLLLEGSIASFGGAEVQQVLLARFLASKGHSVTLFVKRSATCTKPEVAEGVSVVPFPMDWQGGSNSGFPVELAVLWLRLFALDADVYIMKNPRLLLGAVGSAAQLRRACLVFWMAIDRDVDLADRSGQGGFLPQFMYVTSLPWVSHVIAQTRHQLVGCNRIGLPATHLRSLVEVASQLQDGKASSMPRVLWVGSHAARKHPELLLRLAQLIPDAEFEMVAVPDRDGDELEYARAASSIPNLNYVGRVPYGEMGKFFARAWIFVSTSELEGFPNVFLQAWAHGVPVASLHTNPDGILEREGLGICTNGSFEALVATLRELLANGDERHCMGEAARGFVERNHSIGQVGPRYEELLLRLARREYDGQKQGGLP
jgi:glycosyltransferase involved in cell wall biosynthesis